MRFFSLCSWGRAAFLTALGIFLSLGSTQGSTVIGTPDGKVASDSIHLGVVWAPSSHPGPALRTLNHIHDVGATAVRLTHLPQSDTVFARADSLDLRLYVDLPVSYVSAKNLQDALSQAQPQLQRVRRLAERHPSIQYVGLADHADTSEPDACATLEKWTDHVHQRSPELRTYYVTPFRPSTDECVTAVDQPLISTHGRPNPIQRWTAWHTRDSTTGIGTLGTWVTPSSARGLQVPHSPERQARYLETALSRFLSPPQPPVLFVYRWSDQSDSALPSRHYGLIDSSGTPRPSADVVEGFFTGRQKVFAFRSGSGPTSTPIGAIIFGWGIAALLAGLYASSPFFRQTSFRYFRAHGFYLDAVRQGRDVRSLINAALLFISAGTMGIITTLGTQMMRLQPVSEAIVAALPSVLQTPLVRALTAPTAAGLVVALATMGVLALWMTVLTLVARWKQRFAPGQALMLVVWPFWPVFFGGALAIVAATDPPIPLDVVAGVLIFGGIATAFTATVRVLYDFWRVTGIPVPLVTLLALPSPLVLLGVGLTTIVIRTHVPFSLLWHLIVHT